MQSHLQLLSVTYGLKDKIGNFLYQLGFPHCNATQDGLFDLIVRLATYQEEGRTLRPRIILTTDIDSVLKLLPTCSHHRIGVEPLSKQSYTKCLKKSATLATGEWYIYIERTDTQLAYGVLRSGETVLSLKPSHHLTGLDKDTVSGSIALLQQVSQGLVELRSSFGPSLNVSFYGRGDEVTQFQGFKQKLIDQILSDIPQDSAWESTHTFLDYIFQDVRDHGHGTLAVVVDSAKVNAGTAYKFSDAIYLDPPISLIDPVRDYLRSSTPELAQILRSRADLAIGMLNFDGITIFDTAGNVVGYNAFAKPTTARERAAFEASEGGARSRTFNLLKHFTKRELKACFMLSQDGGSNFGETNG